MTSSDSDFEEFLAASWPRFVRAARLMGASRDEAEDAVQSALERCFRKWATVRKAQDPVAYSVTVVCNEVRRAQSKSRRLRESHELLEVRPDAATTSGIEQQDELWRALNQLSAEQREVIVLRYYLDLREVDVASVLGLPLGTVKSRHKRAIDRLSSIFDARGQDEETPR